MKLNFLLTLFLPILLSSATPGDVEYDHEVPEPAQLFGSRSRIRRQYIPEKHWASQFWAEGTDNSTCHTGLVGNDGAAYICGTKSWKDPNKKCRYQNPRPNSDVTKCHQLDGEAKSFVFGPDKWTACVLYDGLDCRKDRSRVGVLQCPGGGVDKIDLAAQMSFKCFPNLHAPGYNEWLAAQTLSHKEWLLPHGG